MMNFKKNKGDDARAYRLRSPKKTATVYTGLILFFWKADIRRLLLLEFESTLLDQRMFQTGIYRREKIEFKIGQQT
jgi:hypothetical protein